MKHLINAQFTYIGKSFYNFIGKTGYIESIILENESQEDLPGRKIKMILTLENGTKYIMEEK